MHLAKFWLCLKKNIPLALFLHIFLPPRSLSASPLLSISSVSCPCLPGAGGQPTPSSSFLSLTNSTSYSSHTTRPKSTHC